jgi:hypothetical protein
MAATKKKTNQIIPENMGVGEYIGHNITTGVGSAILGYGVYHGYRSKYAVNEALKKNGESGFNPYFRGRTPSEIDAIRKAAYAKMDKAFDEAKDKQKVLLTAHQAVSTPTRQVGTAAIADGWLSKRKARVLIPVGLVAYGGAAALYAYRKHKLKSKNT